MRRPGLLLAGLILATPALAGDPWEEAFLSSEPRRLLAAAAEATARTRDEDVVVLLDEVHYRLDGQRRGEARYRLVYRVLTDAGAREWASVAASHAPWFEARPRIRARVVTADGLAHELDPATIAEVAAGDDDGLTYTDRRTLRAPLPAIARGAVVEQEILVTDTAPLFEAGTQFRFFFGSGVPTLRARVVVDAPEGLSLHHVLRGLEGGVVERERAAGRVRLTVQAGPLGPLPEPEPWMPADKPRQPYFALATGESWAHVAEAYSRVVDAQVGVPSPAVARPGIRRDAVAARLIQRLHREVRYTGIEFGEAAIVPRSPNEVLRRRYGDCKDKSALLVSWLRAEGVPAFLALLSTGPGADIDPGLPGFGLFDHAIVVLPGEPMLWIDATDEFGRVNELPVGVRDRLTLIAAPGTTDLVRTPAAAAADNVLRKTREYHLEASGAGRVVETTVTTGSVERAFRSFYSHAEPAALRDSQERYAREEHGTSEVTSAENSDPRDLRAPFRVRVESRTADLPARTGTQSVVSISPAGLFARLPDAIGTEPAERRTPYVLPDPHRVEWSYRIVPPAGYVPQRLPQPTQATFGNASLEIAFAAGADGVVEGRLVFDTGARRIEPEAYRGFALAVRDWRAREPLQVVFEDHAQALLAAGRTCEGLAALRAAVAAAPRSAGARIRLADALLATGFGEAARDEARQAVQLAPASAEAHRTLGWVHEHDLLGRRFRPGYDRAVAISAYAKAKEVDPSHLVARASLAILHEFDERGQHYGRGADLEAAIREWQALPPELVNDQTRQNLLYALAYAGEFDRALEVARAQPESDLRNEAILLLTAARRGVAAALRQAQDFFATPAARRDALLRVGNSLIEMRRYAEGSALLAESVAGAEDAAERRARAALFARVRRAETLEFPPDDPRTPVRRLFALLASSPSEKVDVLDLAGLFDLSTTEREAVRGDPEAFRRGFTAAMRAVAGGGQLTASTFDAVLSLAEFHAEGEPAVGYRVTIGFGTNRKAMFVVRRGDTYVLLAFEDDLEPLAVRALDAADRGDLAAARQWLDWARDAVRGGAPVFARLWGKGHADGINAVRLAAASLFRSPARVHQGIQALQVGREVLPAGPQRAALDEGRLWLLLQAKRDAEALALLQGWDREHPTHPLPFLMRSFVLSQLGRDADVRALAEARLRDAPDDVDAAQVLSQALMRLGAFEEAESVFARMAARGTLQDGDLNNRAWLAVLRDRVDASTLDWARQSTQKQARAANLHTLATLYAEAGHVSEARQLLARAIADKPGDTPGPDDWYVVGRLQEHCGLAAAARLSYERVVSGAASRQDGAATLARRRLAQLPPGAPRPRSNR